MELHQDADHDKIMNRIWSVSGIMNNIIGVSIYGKLYMHHNVASEYTDGEIRHMYKAVNKTK